VRELRATVRGEQTAGSKMVGARWLFTTRLAGGRVLPGGASVGHGRVMVLGRVIGRRSARLADRGRLDTDGLAHRRDSRATGQQNNQP